MSKVYVPLGVTCSTAFILRDRLRLREFSLPFDWVDLNLKGLYNMLNTEPDRIDEHLVGYFAMVSAQRHTVDGTWFPHDLIKGVTLDEVREKYTRRMKRLFALFEADNDLVFLTTFHDQPPNFNRYGAFNDLKQLIQKKTKNNCYFITVNVSNMTILSSEGTDDQIIWHRNLVVPFNGDWSQGEQKALFERDVYQAIINDNIIGNI